MIYTRKQLPKYCRHRPSGRAYVRIEGKMYYLGKYGSEASKREYDRIIAEFVANGRQAFKDPDGVRIDVLVASYISYIEKEVDFSESRKRSIVITLRRLNELYGTQPASSFSTAALKAFRQRLVDEDLGRVCTTLDLYFLDCYSSSWNGHRITLTVSNICFRSSVAM